MHWFLHFKYSFGWFCVKVNAVPDVIFSISHVETGEQASDALH